MATVKILTRQACDCTHAGAKFGPNTIRLVNGTAADIGKLSQCRKSPGNSPCLLSTTEAEKSCPDYTKPGKFQDKFVLKIFGLTIAVMAPFSVLDKKDPYPAGCHVYDTNLVRNLSIVAPSWQVLLSAMKHEKSQIFRHPSIAFHDDNLPAYSTMDGKPKTTT